MKLPWPAAVGGVVIAIVGAAGLIRGAMPLAPVSVKTTNDNPIVVSNAYVRPPVPPTKSAAAYFTVYNTTAKPDRLESVSTGAGEVAVIHTADMTEATNGLVIPAHSKLVLSTGHGHVMIEKLFGTLKPGQTVNLDLTFEKAGVISVAAKVIGWDKPAPTGGK